MLYYWRTKAQVTVLACTSAAGYAIPPFVLYDRQTLNPQLTKGEISGTSYGLSPNGWIDRKLFCDWMFEHKTKCLLVGYITIQHNHQTI